MAEIHIKNVDPQRKAMYAKQCSKRGVKLGELVQKLLNKHFWDQGPKTKIEEMQKEIERLKVNELKAYHDGYKDGLTACNTVGAEEALEDRDFHYCKWVEKKEQGGE